MRAYVYEGVGQVNLTQVQKPTLPAGGARLPVPVGEHPIGAGMSAF